MKKYLLYLARILVLLVTFILVTNIVIGVSTKASIYDSVAKAPVAQTAVVPGAAIYLSGALSSVYKDRVDTAIALYKAKKVSKILVSGDNGTDAHNEVNPVRDYLLQSGIPDADIFLDHAGFDTYSTMYRARDIFNVSSILITSQAFHLPRAVFTARALGIKANGVVVDSGQLPIRNYLREILADEKAVFNIVLHRKPKYLGDEIPITSGNKTGTLVGSVTLSPTCPVERIPPDPQCAPKPFETKIDAYRANKLIKTTQSKTDGSFSFSLPAGEYELRAAGGSVYPRCSPVMATVSLGSSNRVSISCDTGIR